MFSSRLHWDQEPNPISKLLAHKRAGGFEVLDLTESNPTNAGFDFPVDAIVAALADPRILRYDPNPSGMRPAREAVATYYGGQVDPERILLTSSTSEAYGFLFKLLAGSGDEILVPRPSYPLFEFLAALELVEVKPYSLVYHGAWEIDFQTVREQAGSRTRALVLVNPNNPTGSFLHAGDLDRLVAFCAEREIAIISDEVFADYGFGEDSRRVRSLHTVTGALTFCLSGLSKIAALPQMKLGWIVAAGPPALRAAALSGLELIADTYLSVGTPVQIAAPVLLDAGASLRRQIRERTARNLAALRAAIAPDSPLRPLHVDGGWYVTLQVPRVRSEENWVLRLLDQYNVLVQPGYFYDFEAEAFLVLSLLPPPDIFDRAVARLCEFSLVVDW